MKDKIIDNVFSSLEGVGSNHYLAGTLIYMAGEFGGAMNRVGYDESAYPWRQNTRYWVGLNASTKKEEDYEELKRWSNHFQELNVGYGTPLYDGGDQEEIMNKLKKLKKLYDPNNMFRNNLAPINISE